MTWLVPPETLAAYTATAAALVLAPGPSQALVITRSLDGGIAAGIVTAVGINTATLAHSLAAALGLSALLAASATAFTVVKLAGGAYLCWLGVRMLRARAAPPSPAHELADGVSGGGVVATPRTGTRRLLAHGFVTGLLNPKVALFFLAFLPQFVDPTRGHVVAQFLILGGILALLDVGWSAALAWATARASTRIAAGRGFAVWRERMLGAVLVALGVKLALARH